MNILFKEQFQILEEGVEEVILICLFVSVLSVLCPGIVPVCITVRFLDKPERWIPFFDLYFSLNPKFYIQFLVVFNLDTQPFEVNVIWLQELSSPRALQFCSCPGDTKASVQWPSGHLGWARASTKEKCQEPARVTPLAFLFFREGIQHTMQRL